MRFGKNKISPELKTDLFSKNVATCKAYVGAETKMQTLSVSLLDQQLVVQLENIQDLLEKPSKLFTQL